MVTIQPHGDGPFLLTPRLTTALERGLNALRQLDAIMHNVLSHDAAMLAAWTQASHIERPSRRRPKPLPSPTPSESLPPQ